MAESIPKPRRSRWPIFFGGFVLFLVVLYFIASSGPFLRAVVIPMVSSQLKSEITVEELSLSPFSSLRLRGVKIVPHGSAPLATIAEVRIRYGLISILSGKIDVSEITLDSPAITVVQKANSPSNLDTLLRSLKSDTSANSTKPSSPTVRLQNVAIRNGSISMNQVDTNGANSDFVLSGLEVGLDSLANGGKSQLKVAWAMSVTNSISGQFSAVANGQWDLQWAADLKPASIKGELKIEAKKAERNFQAAQGLVATLITDVAPSELKQLELGFRRGTDDAGRITLSGPFDLQKSEARISYQIKGIGVEVASVVGGILGVDFGKTGFSGSGRIDLAQFGRLLASNGRLDLAGFSVRTPGGTTPTTDIGLDYKVSINFVDSTVLLDKVNLSMGQNGRSFLSGNLDRPMNIALNGRGPGFRQATYQLSINGWDLGPWKPVIAPMLPGVEFNGGVVKLDATILSEDDGRSLKLDFTSAISQLALNLPTASFTQGLLKLSMSATWTSFTSVQVDKFGLEFSNAGAQVANYTGTGHYHSLADELSIQIGGDFDLTQALKICPVNGLNFETALGKLSVQVTKRPEGIEGSAGFSLSKLKGTVGTVTLNDYQVRFDSTGKLSQGRDKTGTLQGSALTINRVTLALQNGFETGGTLDFNGNYDLKARKGKLTFKTVNLNQVGLGPWVAAAIAPNKLISIGLDVSGETLIDPEKGQSIKAEFGVNNFRAQDPGHVLPDKPFNLGANVDVSQNGTVTEVSKIILRLGQNARAKNELTLTGHVDLSPTNATPSAMTVKSDGLDLSDLYLLFAQSTGDTNRVVSKSSASPTNPASEPPAIALPFQHLDFDLNIARVFLGEVSISNWVAKAKIDRGVLSLDPFGMAVNGSPLTARATVDLSVPGYKYDVALESTRFPITPFVNTFQPTMSGNVGGTANAKMAVKGAGFSGANLQKNLSGQFDLVATNLNLKINNVQQGFLKGILNVVIGLPDIIRNPSAAIGKLSQLTGLSTTKPDPTKADGWVDQIQAEPLQFLHVQGKIGSGKVDFSDGLIQSSALRISAPGTITLIPVLTNSPLNFVVDVGLRDSLAKRIGLSSANGDYANLPSGCLTVGGTIANPEAKPDTKKLLLLGGKAVLGVVGNTAGAVGDILSQATGTNGLTSTNVLGNALKGLGGLFGPGPTNAPAKPKK